jgi:hypothetical protein
MSEEPEVIQVNETASLDLDIKVSTADVAAITVAVIGVTLREYSSLFMSDGCGFSIFQRYFGICQFSQVP